MFAFGCENAYAHILAPRGAVDVPLLVDLHAIAPNGVDFLRISDRSIGFNVVPHDFSAGDVEIFFIGRKGRSAGDVIDKQLQRAGFFHAVDAAGELVICPFILRVRVGEVGPAIR